MAVCRGRLCAPRGRFDLIRRDVERWADLDDPTRARHTRWPGGTVHTYHQAFGTGPFYGGENTAYKAHHLLLRLHEDAALGWDTMGDRDVKFPIPHDDLVAGNWDAAFVDAGSGA